MPSVIFSHTFSAREGTAHKHPPAVSSHIFPRVTYAKYAPLVKMRLS
mgnify:CR=1 FL=1